MGKVPCLRHSVFIFWPYGLPVYRPSGTSLVPKVPKDSTNWMHLPIGQVCHFLISFQKELNMYIDEYCTECNKYERNTAPVWPIFYRTVNLISHPPKP